MPPQGFVGLRSWVIGEDAAECYQGRDDTCQGKASAADGFGDQSREVELIPQFIRDKECTRRGNVFPWLVGRWPFAFCANYGCSSRWVFGTWAGLMKPHGTKHLVCSRLLYEKVWSPDQAWAVGTWADTPSAESKRKPLNLSLGCQRAAGARTILGHHYSHRKCFLIFPKMSIQSHLDWLITSCFQVINFLTGSLEAERKREV